MADYDKQLLRESANYSLTAERIGELMNCYGPDGVTRLRQRKDLRVVIVGERPSAGRGRSRKLYRVYKVTPIRGAYCCGYCEQQRQLEQ